MKKITIDWLQSANDDILVIESIIKNKALTHVVAFHAQQAIEKSLKAILDEYEIEINKIHKLDFLHKQVIKIFNIQIDTAIIEELDSLYIDSRYPGQFGLLPFGKPSVDDAYKYLNIAKQVIQAIKLHLSDNF